MTQSNADQRVSIALTVDAGTGSSEHSKLLNALINLCNHEGVKVQRYEKIAALEYVLEIERQRK